LLLHKVNKLTEGKMSNFLSFGEIMLRLKTPGLEWFFQSP